MLVDSEWSHNISMTDCQLTQQELETISGSMGKGSIPMPLTEPVPFEKMFGGCRMPHPINMNRDKEIKRLRKIVRRLRKRNKG